MCAVIDLCGKVVLAWRIGDDPNHYIIPWYKAST